MSDNYQKIIDVIDQQEAILRFDSFSNQNALDLGNFLVKKAQEKGASLAVAIRKPTGNILFHHIMEGTNSNNQNWMRRKYNSVCYFEASSLRAWALGLLMNETLDDHGLSRSDYVLCGGGFPVLMKTGELVAVITVSNLPHFNDHQFIADCLAEYLNAGPIPSVLDIE